MLIQVSVTVIRLNPSPNSLESQEDKLQPKPGQSEHEDHVREGKAEPAGKVKHISVLRKESRENNKRNFLNFMDHDWQQYYMTSDNVLRSTHWPIWPLSTRLGPVPVSVAVPPMLAA